MTSFGWKRKSSQLSSAPAVFTPDQDDQDKEEEEASDPDFDWIAVAKRRRVAALEDNRTLFLRLKQEGEVLSLNCRCIYLFIIYYLHTKVLAEQERFWQAINRWDNALALDPTGDNIASFHIKKTNDGCIEQYCCYQTRLCSR